MARLLAIGAGMLLLVLLWTYFAPEPPTLYVGGPIVTMDSEGRVVEALLVEDDRIAAVGSEEEVRARAGSARVVDLEGAALLPGFIDAHGHFPGEGMFAVVADLNSPPIGDVADMDELVARLGALAEGRAAGEWVTGLGYDDTLLPELRHPTRADLDRASTEHPVAAIHISGHLASVNSVGLEALGIDRDTPDPEGGRIRRDATGEPDGVLEETAMEAMTERLASPGLLEVWAILQEALRRYLTAGVTTAQNGYATPGMMQLLGWAARLGQLPLRVVIWPGMETADAILAGEFSFESPDPLHVRLGAVKLVADGSIQGYTGYLSEPYHVPPGDDPDYRGYPRMAKQDLVERVTRYHEAGWQTAIHGNGDASIDDVLDAIQAAHDADPREDSRPVVIHSQMAREDQLDRMATLGVIPSFFSLHTYYWGDRHRDLFMGPERAARMSPARSARDRGIRFTIHCDSPIVPMEPLRLVWAAVNRRTSSGAPMGDAQRITPMEALRAVTIDAARQHFEEDVKGSLEPGKLADLVILSRSPLDDPERIDEIEVLETIVGGETVYRKP